MARAMRAISDIRPNWLFDASLMMGTTCPRIALMYSMLVAPSIKAPLVGATQVRPMQRRRSLDTPHAEANNVNPHAGRMAGYRTGRGQSAGKRDIAEGRECFWFQSPAFHFASGQISGTSLPLCVQGSTVHSSLVLRSLITAVLCGPSVNRNRDTGAAIVWCRNNLSWSRTSSSEFVLLVVSMQSN